MNLIRLSCLVVRLLTKRKDSFSIHELAAETNWSHKFLSIGAQDSFAMGEHLVAPDPSGSGLNIDVALRKRQIRAFHQWCSVQFSLMLWTHPQSLRQETSGSKSFIYFLNLMNENINSYHKLRKGKTQKLHVSNISPSGLKRNSQRQLGAKNKNLLAWTHDRRLWIWIIHIKLQKNHNRKKA